MKKIYKIFFIVASPFLLNGCFSLDQEPFTELSQKTSFQTMQDAQFWVNGMYSRLRQNFYGSSMYATDVQADFLNMARRSANVDALTNLHNWSFFVTDNATTAVNWRRYFLAIQNINIALEGIPTIPIPSQNYETNVATIRHHMGELYLGRAFCYSYLVTHFCEAYNESSPYGLPLLSQPTINNFPARSSLKETYEFILADIARAEENLRDVTGSAGAQTFTKDAVTALKARILLYKGDWAQAYTAATSLLGATYPLTTTESALTDVWANDATAEAITLLFARYDRGNNAELPDNNNIYIGEQRRYLTGEVNDYFPGLIPTQTFVDLFDDTDFRKNVYIKKLFASYGNTRYNDIYLVYKYPDNPALKNTPTDESTYMHRPKLFRIAEQYLIAAEAAYRNGDDANARIYLDRLRTARGIGSITYTDLWTEIQNERNRELAFEGFRMTDIKRWGLGVVRGTPQNLDAIVREPAQDYYQANIPAGNYKMTWPIPPDDIQHENGNWTQNPGW